MSTTAIPTSMQSRAEGGKYLAFALGKEEYALPILKVREIIGYMDITSLPRMPSHLKGIINLRGQVISVIDLRARFGMEAAVRTKQACIIVVELQEGDRRFHCGVSVDHVSEVLNIDADSIEDAPDLGPSVRTDFIVGIGKVGNSVKILLNLDRVFDTADLIGQPTRKEN